MFSHLRCQKNLVLELSLMINAYIALLIYFPPKKISDVRRGGGEYIYIHDKFFTLTALSNQNLKQFTVCSFFLPHIKLK